MFNVTLTCVIVMMSLTMLFFMNGKFDAAMEKAEAAEAVAWRFYCEKKNAKPNRATRRKLGTEHAKELFAYAKIAKEASDAKAEEAATYRRRMALSVGLTIKEAEEAANNVDWSPKDLGKVRSTHFVGDRRFKIGVLDVSSFVFDKKTKTWFCKEGNTAVRGGCILSDYSNFNDGKDGHPTVVVINWNLWFDDGEKMVRKFVYNDRTYLVVGGSQGGLKKGICVAFEESFYEAHKSVFENERLDKLSTQKRIQRISLMLSTAKKTNAKMTQMIVIDAFDRTDNGNVTELIPTGDAKKPWSFKASKLFKNALIDGAAIADSFSGLWIKSKKVPEAFFVIGRPCKGGYHCFDFKKLGLIGKKLPNHWGVEQTITRGSIIVTTDCVKDIDAYPAEEGEAGYQAWLEGQVSENLYICNTFSHSGWVRISRQMCDKFTQVENIKELIRVTLNHDFALLNTKQGVIDEIKRLFPILKLPELEAMIGSKAMYNIVCRNAVNLYTRVKAGSLLLKGSVCYGVPDRDWVVEACINNADKLDKVELSRTAGSIPIGCCRYGKYNWDTDENGNIKLDSDGLPTVNGKPVWVAVGRYPQINMKLPVLRVVGNGYARGVIAFSMRDGETALIDLDADLDGDEFYVFEDAFIVEAIRKANEVFNMKTTVFCGMTMNPEAKTCSIEQYLYWARSWSEVGLGIFQIFPLMEMIPLLKEDEDWQNIKVPIIVPKEKGKGYDWKYRKLGKVKDEDAPIIAQQGHNRTDAAKRGTAPGTDEKVSAYYSMLALSELDAHPEKRGNVKPSRRRLEEKLTEFPRLNDGIIRRIGSEIERRGYYLMKQYDHDGNVIEVPNWVVNPTEGKFEGVAESVWKKQLRDGLQNLPNLVLSHNDIKGHSEFAKMYAQGAASDKKAMEKAEQVYSLIQAFETAHDIQSIDVKEDERDTVKMIDVDMTTSIMTFMHLWAQQNSVKASDEELFWIAYNNLAENYFSKSESRPDWAVGQFLRSFREPITMAVLENRGDHVKAPKADEDPTDGCINMKEAHVPTSTLSGDNEVMPEGNAYVDSSEELSDEDKAMLAERAKTRSRKSKKPITIENEVSEGNSCVDNPEELSEDEQAAIADRKANRRKKGSKQANPKNPDNEGYSFSEINESDAFEVSDEDEEDIDLDALLNNGAFMG